jgi:hypothetical protein
VLLVSLSHESFTNENGVHLDASAAHTVTLVSIVSVDLRVPLKVKSL